MLVARTDADSAKLLTSDIDERDKPFLHGGAQPRRASSGRQARHRPSCIARGEGLRADTRTSIWMRDLHAQPRPRRKRVRRGGAEAHFPNKRLAYNCSPSASTGRSNLDDATIAKFQRETRRDGLQVPVHHAPAGFHSLNHSMFELASAYRDEGMSAYVRLQEAEFASEDAGYEATKHQREVGTGYFDAVVQTISGGQASPPPLRFDRGGAVPKQASHAN